MLADHEEYPGTLPLLLDTVTIYPTFLESRVILVLETRMRFPLGGLQALGLIQTHIEPRLETSQLLRPNSRDAHYT